MIKEDFITLTPKGLYCKTGNFYLDPLKPVENAVITHAHSDHAVPFNHNVYCTAPTLAFIQKRYAEGAGKNFIIKNFAETFSTNNVKITFYPAGHILGSSQVLIENDTTRYLYTGDFKLQPDNTCEPFHFLKADVLITESTFANPAIAHPNDRVEIEKINHHKEKNIVIGAYGLGKTQRITKLINNFCTEREVMIHPDVMAIQKIYEQHGIDLGKWKPYSRQVFKSTKNKIYIVPPRVFSSFYKQTGFYIAFASGWEQLQRRCDFQLMISDHADWNDILLLIERVSPKLILTLHGNGQFIKKHFEGTDIKVQILN